MTLMPHTHPLDVLYDVPEEEPPLDEDEVDRYDGDVYAANEDEHLEQQYDELFEIVPEDHYDPDGRGQFMDDTGEDDSAVLNREDDFGED